MDDISNIKLDFSQEIDCKNVQTLDEILHQFDRCKDDLVHKQNIDKIINIYLFDGNDLERTVARRIFINCFTKFNSRKHTRKYLCETVKKTRIFERIVKETIDDIVSDIKHNNFPILLTNDFMNFIYTNLQNFTISQFEFVINQLFPFYYLILETFVQQIRNSSEISDEIQILIHYVLQHELIVLSKSDSETLKAFSIDFIRLNHEILCNPTIKFDMKSKCGLILGYFLNHLPETEKTNIKHKNSPILDILDNIQDSKDYCLKLEKIELSNIFIDDDDKMKIVLYSTLYNTVDIKVLKSVNLLVETYRKLLNYGIRFTGYPEQIILISRNLCYLIKEFDNLDDFEQIFDETLPFIWSHLEHFIESVCHNIRQLYKNLINLSCYHKIYLEKLLKTINTMSWFSTVRLNALKIFAETQSDYMLENDHNLHQYLLTVITDENMSIKAAEIYIKLLEKVTNLDDVEFVANWLRPILQISRNTTNEQCAIYQNIITEAFKMKPTIFRILFNRNRISNSVENGAFLKCIQYARNHNLIVINNDDDDDGLIWRQLVPKNKLQLFMIDQNDDIRILVLETIIETQKTTEEISDWEFVYLYNYYSYNASTQIPNIRKKIGNFYKKFLNRYQLSYGLILKKYQQNQQEIYRNKLVIYDRFLRDFTKLTINYYGLDSNHPRRSLSLELLIILQKIVSVDIWITLFTIRDIENLKNIVFDSYESNKVMAVTLLSSLPSELLGFISEDTSLDYFKKCQLFVLDIRPSISLSASYMFQICLFTNYPKKIQQLSNQSTYNNLRYDILLILIEQLEHVYLETKDDLLKASQQSPIYGLLITIKMLLSQRQLNDDNHLYLKLFKQLINLCLIIKNNIMPIVCNRSPEGNLLDGDDYEMDETSIAQMILVYSWRTMKEIMLLFNEIVKQTILLQNQLNLLDENDLFLIGDFFIDIFIQSKHRGVFEQAHIAFSSICYNFWRSNNVNIRNLPLNWLNTAVAFCTGDLSDERLCSTRRSAGLPFLILSVLTTEPNFTNFEKTMNLLLTVVEIRDDCDDDNVGNRMHSLNVLRFIFINSKIGDLVTAWIDKAMIAALKGFKSTCWGIRNSSTLLFSALITRIFGVQRSNDLENLSPKNRLTISTFNLRYPNLLKFLLKILIEEADNKQSQILHPILLILARLYPSHNDKTHNYIQEFIPQISKCLSHPVYRTRDLAGRALVSLVCSDIQIFQQYSTITENNKHGILLQIWHLLKTGSSIDQKFAIDFIRNFSNNLNNLTRKSSHTTLSLWMETTTLLLLRITAHESEEFLNALKNIVGILTKDRQICRISTSKTTYEWNRSLLLLCILIKQFELTTITPKIIAKEIVYCLYSNDNELKSKCLLFLIYLNQSSGKFGDEHPLFYYENLEIPSTIHNFIDSCTIHDKNVLHNSMEKVIKYFIYGELLGISRKSQDSSLILTILLMKFYPNILQQFYKQKEQQFLDLMLEICNENDEELTCAISTTITSFLLGLNQQQWKILNFAEFIGILMKFSSPAAAEFSRLTITRILSDLTPFYYNNFQILDEFSLFNLANTIMVLLEDEESIIRNSVANIIMKQNKKCWYCVPCKAREEILLIFCKLLSFSKTICFLLLWATRQRNLITNDISEIYECGELNQYAENYDIVQYCCKLLNQHFCNLHPLEITQQILKVINENPVLCSKRELIQILGKIIDFIVKKQDFRVSLFQLFDDLREDQRSASFEWFLLNLYKPFL